MSRPFRLGAPRTVAAAAVAAWILVTGSPVAAPELMGPLPGPFPLFPADNWWNVDVTEAPVDPRSDELLGWIGLDRTLHPDLGGDVSPGSDQNYGFSYAMVDGDQPKLAVEFLYSDESDGVDHDTDTSFPYYPIPDEAITEPHWVEGGEPGNVDLRSESDRHLLIVDRDGRDLYELYNVWHDGTRWHAGSGASFDLEANDRRPEGWTSADAAGLAILPGLIRWEEANGTEEIGHAFRVTVRATADFWVYPASHRAGSDPSAPPMGMRMRLRPEVDLSSHPPDVQRIFRAMKTHGLIVADNGSDMYVSGTYDNRWDNDVLNPAFRSLTAGDFEVIELGWSAPSAPALLRDASVSSLRPLEPTLGGALPLDPATDLYLPALMSGDVDPESILLDSTKPLVFYATDGEQVLRVEPAGETIRFLF